MLKFFMITLVIFSCSLFANEQDLAEQISKCDQIYDECSIKCEKNESTNNEECFVKCESLFDKCQNEIEKLEVEQQQKQN